MSPSNGQQVTERQPNTAAPCTNDLSLRIATTNGTGSATANRLVLRAIFRMGIPVSGKNIFPSNIQGLPTWFDIRASADGWTGHRDDYDIVVAMNPASYEQDVSGVRSGGWLVYDDTRALSRRLQRPDITLIGVPLARLVAAHFEGSRLLLRMKNIAYVGALAALLNMDRGVVERLLAEGPGAKKKGLLESNLQAFELGWTYVREHYACPLPIHLAPMDRNRDAVLMDGNTAAALGCLFAGATVVSWYPITPSTSLVQAFERYARRYRKDEQSGRLKAAVIQAEDELAAAGMVVGASWMGARAFSATSGPGISLMSEFIGLAYYAEIPLVLFDVQRTGPSTGMPTRTQQSDILTVAYASHGDTKHVALFPADPKECFNMAAIAFDLAERFQTPVFVVSDLDIGMNEWVIPAPEWDDGYRPDRGKVINAAALEAGVAFHRYDDPDGDGVPWRSLPGSHADGAFFTRGSGHDRLARYTEDAEPYTQVMDRLALKHRNAAQRLPPPVMERRAGAALGLVTIGGCDLACREAIDRLAREGIRVDYLRVRAFPFAAEVESFLLKHRNNFVVEQNRDGQLCHLLAAETAVAKNRLISVRHYGGLPLSAMQVVDSVRRHLDNLASTGARSSATSGNRTRPPAPLDPAAQQGTGGRV